MTDGWIDECRFVYLHALIIDLLIGCTAAVVRRQNSELMRSGTTTKGSDELGSIRQSAPNSAEDLTRQTY